MRRDIDFILAHADGFDEHKIEARGVETDARARRWCAPVRRDAPRVAMERMKTPASA